MPKESWDRIIRPKSSLLKLNLKTFWGYKDLLLLFVKRDIIVTYKQTILGPLWFIIQPILTTLVFTVVFGQVANISTDGIPQPLFYMAGIVIWNYFADCFTKTSNIFVDNASVFGKVYFPRLISPISVIISNGLKFLIQLIIFVILVIYYYRTDGTIHPTTNLLFLPLLILLMAMFGLGFGLIFSSLTTKYRDLKFLMQFGVQLLMYATPIIYPMSAIPDKYQSFLWLNPFSHIIEGFKAMFFGTGNFEFSGIIYSICLAIIICFFGLLIFNKTEKTFMDTV